MKSILRRSFLKTGAAVFAGLSSGVVLATQDNGMAFEFANLENSEWVKNAPPEKLAFEELVGDVFWARHDDYEPMVNLTLQDVITTGDYSFILRFHTSDTRRLNQVTHLVEHAGLGRTAMFLTANPVTDTEHLEGFDIDGEAREPSDFYYEASFSYMTLSAEQKTNIPIAVNSEGLEQTK